MIGKVLNFFLENINEDSKSIDFLKIKTLIATLLSAIILISLLIIRNSFLKQFIASIIPATIFLAIITMLYYSYR